MSKEKHIVFAFGRMNPPTAGHSKLVDKVHSEQEKGTDHRVIVSHSQDKHKNPLTSAQKIRYLKHVHPQGKFEGSSSSQPHVFAHLRKCTNKDILMSRWLLVLTVLESFTS